MNYGLSNNFTYILRLFSGITSILRIMSYIIVPHSLPPPLFLQKRWNQILNGQFVVCKHSFSLIHAFNNVFYRRYLWNALIHTTWMFYIMCMQMIWKNFKADTRYLWEDRILYLIQDRMFTRQCPINLLDPVTYTC